LRPLGSGSGQFLIVGVKQQSFTQWIGFLNFTLPFLQTNGNLVFSIVGIQFTWNSSILVHFAPLARCIWTPGSTPSVKTTKSKTSEYFSYKYNANLDRQLSYMTALFY
jgi:hypothetical protein